MGRLHPKGFGIHDPTNARLGLMPSPSPGSLQRPATWASTPTRPASDSLGRMLWRQCWLILGCVLAVLSGAVVYLTRSTPLHTSTSRIYVEQTGPRIIHETQPGVMTASLNYLYTQAELMKATPVISAALEACGAEGLRVFARADPPIDYLQRHLEVSVGRKDEIIRVSFTSPYPDENAQVVNAVVDAYVTWHAARKRSTSTEVLRILQKEKASRDRALSDQLRALMKFREDHPTLAFQTDLGNTIFERFERLSAALTEAQLAALEAKSYYDAALQTGDLAGLLPFVEARAAAGQGGDPLAETTALKAQLRDLKRIRSDRLQWVADTHPTIQALDAEIAQTQVDIAALEKRFVQSHLAVLRQQVLAAQEKEAQLAARFEEQRQQVAGLNEVKAQYAILESEYSQTKSLCDVLDDRIRELNVIEDAGALNITILETARPTLTPSRPRQARVLAIALVLSLMLGGGAALVREVTDRRVRSEDEVTRLLGFPLLGEVPVMSRWGSPTERAQQAALAPSSAVAEAFRTIRTAVYLGLPHEQARVIQVTSAVSGEGKSTVTSNLAMAMAQSGRTVLIVDANFRQPVQHLVFGVGGEVGLASVLARRQRLRDAIVATSTPGLDLLPAGQGVPNPAEMLGGMLFGAVLARLAQHYDRVLVDTPPIGPMADARIVAAQCQAVILVVRPGVCTYEALRRARESLLHGPGVVLGAVVNGVRVGRGWGSQAGWTQGPQGDPAGGNTEQRVGTAVARRPWVSGGVSSSQQPEEGPTVAAVSGEVCEGADRDALEVPAAPEV